MNLSETIGQQVRSLRLEKNMSLGQLAQISGISKVMLSQIEKGVANPTINTLWKIANGLQVPYAELIAPSTEEATFVTYTESNMQYSPDGKCRIFCYYPMAVGRRSEIFVMELQQGACYESPGHPQKSKEYIIVDSGSLTLRIQDKEYRLKQGDSLCFSASVTHVYANPATPRTKVYLINEYAV